MYRQILCICKISVYSHVVCTNHLKLLLKLDQTYEFLVASNASRRSYQYCQQTRKLDLPLHRGAEAGLVLVVAEGPANWMVG